MKLYVVTHKESSFIPKDRIFIGVGKNKEINNVELYDNTNLNISEKNFCFCELTALYWIWKNTKDDIVGLEHYRRFFCKKSHIFSIRTINSKKIINILKKYDCILPPKYQLFQSVFKDYNYYHDINDLMLCKDIINRLYPDYVKDFDKVMNQNDIYTFNMFIMKKDLLDSYCSWLFDILFEAEKSINLNAKDDYQVRVFGFLSERLFNVWLLHNKLSIKSIPVYMPNDTKYNSLKNKLSKILNKKKVQK